MHLKLVSSFTFLLLSQFYFCQTGGRFSFAFLDLDFSARNAATAGSSISMSTKDLNIATINPSLLNKEMHKKISFNHGLLSGGINYGMLAYAHTFKFGTFDTYLKYNDYGEFTMTEANGEVIGNFRPFEYVFGVGFGKELNPNISVGANLNLIGSNLETYSAYGLSMDLVGTYMHLNKLFSISAIVKNAGFKIKDYTSNDTGILPADMQLAFSYKLAHAPFRFSMLIHHLNKWELGYNDPNSIPTYDALTGDTIPVPATGFIENMARHLSFSTELSITKNIQLRLGLNYLKRQELKLEDRPGMSGFTMGLGFNFEKIRIDYAFVVYSRAGFNNLLSISTPLDKWRKQKKMRIITTPVF
ncbi:MAG: type IX secretion system protein PorQ [Crocinitomicaceae bacterium]|nr:type IX secretion system protein PorQ [Crocinitomicaceae bacterium]